MAGLIPAIVQAVRTSEDLDHVQNARPSTTTGTFNVAYQHEDFGIEIDQYNSDRNVWRKVKTVDLKTKCSTMVVRGADLIIIGGKNVHGQTLNAVSFMNNVFHFENLKLIFDEMFR